MKCQQQKKTLQKEFIGRAGTPNQRRAEIRLSWRNGFLRQIEQGFSIIQSCQDILQKNVFDLNSGRYPKITFWTDPPTKIKGETNYKLSKNCLLSTKVYRLLYNRIIKKIT